MPLYSVFCLDHPPHAMAKRDAVRTEHRAYVKANDAPIRFVGVCSDDDGNQCSSFYIFEAENEQEVRDWFAEEPFAKTGVYQHLIVREFMLGLNRLAGQGWPGG